MNRVFFMFYFFTIWVYLIIKVLEVVLELVYGCVCVFLNMFSVFIPANDQVSVFLVLSTEEYLPLLSQKFNNHVVQVTQSMTVGIVIQIGATTGSAWLNVALDLARLQLVVKGVRSM